MERISEQGGLLQSVTRGNRTIFFLLAALVLTVYAGSLSHGFTGDDVTLFSRNDFYGDLKNIPVLFLSDFILQYADIDAASSARNLYSGFVAYRPVTALTFFADHLFWGQQPLGYHLTNILLHIFAVCLVYVLACRLLKNDAVALLGALLFAVHPIQVELVNTAGYRSDLLAVIFYLTSFIWFIKFREKETGPVALAVSFAAFALAVFSKESAVTLPVMLLAYDFLVLRKATNHKLLTKWPHVIFWGILSFYLYVYFFIFPNATLSADIHVSFWDKIRLFVQVFAKDLTALFWPFQVSVLPQLYWPPLGAVHAAQVAVVVSFAAASIAAGAYFFKRSPSLSFLILWFFVTYLPTANIIPSPNPLAYRLLYLPAVGLFIVLAFLIENISRQASKRFGNFQAGVILKVIVVAVCVILTMELNSFFQNNEVFCQKIIRDFPKASRPFWILGLTYLESRQYDKAIASFQHYLDIKEDNPFVREVRQDYFIHHQMGRCYVYDHKKAIAEFQKSIQLRPGYALAHADLAKAYLLTENYQAALGHAVKAVELDGNLIFGYVYAIHSALELGERAQAQEFMKKALTVSPEDPNLHYLKNRMATE